MKNILFAVLCLMFLFSCRNLHKTPDEWTASGFPDLSSAYTLEGVAIKVLRLSTNLPGMLNEKLVSAGVRCSFKNTSPGAVVISKNKFSLQSAAFRFHDASAKYGTADSVALQPGEVLDEVVLVYDSDSGVSYKEYDNFVQQDTVTFSVNNVVVSKFVCKDCKGFNIKK